VTGKFNAHGRIQEKESTETRLQRPIHFADLWNKDRTANGTFASISPVANRVTVGFGYPFTPSPGLTHLVNGRKRLGGSMRMQATDRAAAGRDSKEPSGGHRIRLHRRTGGGASVEGGGQ